MKKRNKRLFLFCIIFVIAIGSSIPFLFKITMIEHTLNMQLPSKTKVLDYKIAYGKLYAKIEITHSQFEEISKKFEQGISYSASPIKDPFDYFEQMKTSNFVPKKSIEDVEPKKILAYASNISGSPSVDACLIEDSSGRYFLYVLH